MMTVLLTGCNNHLRSIVDCLRSNSEKEPVRLIGTDCNPNHLIGIGCDVTYAVPRSDAAIYVPEMLSICEREKVDVILPFVTSELHVMAANAHRFEEIGTKVSVSSAESIRVANNKVAMYERFSRFMPYQRIVQGSDGIDEFAKEIGYPNSRFCCKLPESCGGNGFSVIDETFGRDIRYRNKCGIAGFVSLDALKELADNYDGKIILSEYITGKDYSVCVLADHGKVIHSCGYIGYEMDYGSVMLGEIMKIERAYQIAEDVCNELGIDGNACFDFMVGNDGRIALLEVNPRLSASLSFVAAAGLNLPYLRCKQLLGEDVKNIRYSLHYGLKMRKYYACEYV